MKNSELEVLHNSLSNLADVKLPYKISYAVTKNILELEDTLKPYNTERNKLIDRYCKKDDTGKPIISENKTLSIDEKYNAEYLKAISELGDIECEFTPHYVKESEIETINTSLTPRQMAALLKIVEV